MRGSTSVVSERVSLLELAEGFDGFDLLLVSALLDLGGQFTRVVAADQRLLLRSLHLPAHNGTLLQ